MPPTDANAITLTDVDSRIKAIFEQLSKEKDQKIQQLEARIEQLAHRGTDQPIKPVPSPPLDVANPEPVRGTVSIMRRLSDIGEAITRLQQAAMAKGLSVSMYFDFNYAAHTSLIRKLGGLSDGMIQSEQALTSNDVVSGDGLDVSAQVDTHAKPSFTHSSSYFKTAMAKVSREEQSTTVITDAAAPAAPAKAAKDESTIMTQLSSLQEDVGELKAKAAKNGLNMTGFIDVKAKTDNASEQTFNLGYVELDLEYAYDEHFAASTALNFDFSTASGGRWSGVAVALIDYHLFNDRTPPRGRIFNNQGFHIQAGRFDLPFSTDYQNFTNTNRVTVTAPITTSRMQFGGFYGTGLRSYGSWKHVNYAAFLTNSVYANDGHAIGGHLGINLGQNPYRTHNVTPEGIELGISYLSDLDKQHNLRHSVYGADVSMGYGFLKLQSEFMWLKSHESFIGADNIDYGKPNQFGYHTTLIADLKSFIDYPVLAIARYGRWQPSTRFMNDFDNSLVAIDNVSALTIGLNYHYNDHFDFKVEYTDSLGTETHEKLFDKQLGIAQMVVSF